MIEKIIKENKNKAIVVFLVIILIGSPLAAAAAFLSAFHNRIYPQIFVCQIPLAGKTKTEAETALISFLKRNYPEKISLIYKENTYSLDPNSLRYDSQTTVRKSFSLGREKSFLFNLGRLASLFRKKEQIPFSFQLDHEKVDSEIEVFSSKLYQPAIDPQLKIVRAGKQKNVAVEVGKNGQEVELRTLKTNLLAVFSCPQKEIILALPVKPVLSKISTEAAETARQRAVLLLNKKLILKSGEQSWTVGDEEIINFISFSGGFSRSKITDYTHSLTSSVNTPPENAVFLFENNRVNLFRPSKEGKTIKEAEFVESFEKKLITLEQNQENQEMEIPVLKTSAKISTGDVNTLGIKELLGKGSSLFYGSISERIHNINLAGLRLSGILVAPQEEFSFNQSLGEVSENTGFKQAYIIKEGRTILGDGGGVCQVSTTLFRAALNAGLPITERHAHAYRVHYYEDDLGPGFDATVFDPTADLKFKNNTPSYLLIQSSINIKTKKLTFEIYGTSDNRKVAISKARIWDKVPPLPDFYQDDPTLPAGVIKQVDWKAWGAKAAFDYKVTKNGEVLEEKTFFSNYRPWQAVYLRGTRI